MKKLFKKFGQIPFVYYGLGLVLGNVLAAMLNNVYIIIGFNIIALLIGLIGIAYKDRGYN